MMEQAARRVKKLVRLTDVLTRYNLTVSYTHLTLPTNSRV